jgi:hypothetical protein
VTTTPRDGYYWTGGTGARGPSCSLASNLRQIGHAELGPRHGRIGGVLAHSPDEHLEGRLHPGDFLLRKLRRITFLLVLHLPSGGQIPLVAVQISENFECLPLNVVSAALASRGCLR